MDLQRFRRRGLRANLVVWFSTLLILLFVTTGIALSTMISRVLGESLVRRGSAMVQMLANRAELPLLQSDRDGAARIALEAMEDPDVTYVAVLGKGGKKVLAARFRDAWKDRASQILLQRRTHLDRLEYQDARLLHFGVEVKSHHIVAHAPPEEGATDLLLGEGLDTDASPAAAKDVEEESLGYVVLGMSRGTLRTSLWKIVKLMAGLLAAGLVIFVLAAFAITRTFILDPIGVMKRAAMRMSEFDLTGRTERLTDDELGELSDALNGIVENMHGVLGRVQGVTDSLTVVAERVHSTSQVVAQASASTATSVDQTSSSMAEMLASLKGIAEDIETLARSAEESSSSILEMAATNDEVTANIGSLASSVEETTTAIEEMTYSIKEVARNVEGLSAAAEETSSAMNQMDVSISQVEMNANETARLSEQVSLDAKSAGEALGKTIEGIDNIRESSRVAADVIEALGEKISKIGSILEVIDEVADQTNLLALNAAIIAAQAGEHGKGFAVLAEEIKDLAERTGTSTKEIADLIASVQEESRNAIGAMEKGVQRVDEGVRLAGEADVALRQILDSAGKSTQMVKAIARATVEQSRGSKQVTDAISRIAETVQEIARATAEQARGSEQIMRSAERMKIITKHVERSSQEQARGSKQITRAIESISEMVQRLNGAQKEQTKGAEQVMLAVENIKDATDRQGAAVRELELSVETLSEQAEVLRNEVRRFRT